MNRVPLSMPVRERVEASVEFDPNGGCWFWSKQCLPSGYGCIKVDGRDLLAHRASWASINGSIPPGAVVRHKCDVPQCVNPDHLELGTPRDNRHDCVSRGRARGSVVGRRNLTSRDVALIRDRISAGWKDHQIAKELGIARQSVGRRRRAMGL